MSGMGVGRWRRDSPSFRQLGGGCEWAAGYTLLHTHTKKNTHTWLSPQRIKVIKMSSGLWWFQFINDTKKQDTVQPPKSHKNSMKKTS